LLASGRATSDDDASSPSEPTVGEDRVVTSRIYSVGYEGMTLDALVDRLVGARVSVLVDVRFNPVSRKPGFSKKSLTAVLEDAGIEYVHEKELGNPQDNRDSFRNGDGETGRSRMRAMLNDGGGEALDRLVDLASNQRVAVLCVERDHSRCHRDVITDMAVERNPDIEVLQIL
jgi:uncharacterized protein (DUF488 family)